MIEREIIDEIFNECHYKHSRISEIYIEYELYDKFIESGNFGGESRGFGYVGYIYRGIPVCCMKDTNCDIAFKIINYLGIMEFKYIKVKEYLADREIKKLLTE